MTLTSEQLILGMMLAFAAGILLGAILEDL